MMGSRTSSQVFDSKIPLHFSDTHTHTLFTHKGDSVCLVTGCVIQCGAGCGWADPIRSEGGLLARLRPGLLARRIIYGPFILAECVCSQA